MPATLPKARCGHGEDAVGDTEDVDEALPEPTTGDGEDEHPESQEAHGGQQHKFFREDQPLWDSCFINALEATLSSANVARRLLRS